MKKICWMVIFAFLICCLFACQSSQREQQYGDQLTQSQKEEIEKAYNAVFNGARLYWDEDHRGFGVRYYGGEKGYAILFRYNAFCVTETQKIAGHEFTSNQTFFLYGYKDGQFHLLNDLYKQGIISEQTIENLSDVHREYEEVLLKELRPDLFE